MLFPTLLSYPYYRDYYWKYKCLETLLRKLLYLKFGNFNLRLLIWISKNWAIRNLKIRKLEHLKFETKTFI